MKVIILHKMLNPVFEIKIKYFAMSFAVVFNFACKMVESVIMKCFSSIDIFLLTSLFELLKYSSQHLQKLNLWLISYFA